jgi:hypothetical protein
MKASEGIGKPTRYYVEHIQSIVAYKGGSPLITYINSYAVVAILEERSIQLFEV